MADLRAGGDAIGGPAPFAKADRSRFLSALDEAIGAIKRAPHPAAGAGMIGPDRIRG
jgi:uncharacterized protein YaiI (UPF0178 family)